MSEKYELSEFQKELEKAEHLFSMYWTRKELKNRLDKIEQKDKYINSLLQYTNDLETQLQQKENAIKEARKYIEVNKVKYYQDYSGDESYYDVFLTEGEIIKLLEILDKVGETDDSKRDV